MNLRRVMRRSRRGKKKASEGEKGGCRCLRAVDGLRLAAERVIQREGSSGSERERRRRRDPDSGRRPLILRSARRGFSRMRERRWKKCDDLTLFTRAALFLETFVTVFFFFSFSTFDVTRASPRLFDREESAVDWFDKPICCDMFLILGFDFFFFDICSPACKFKQGASSEVRSLI